MQPASEMGHRSPGEDRDLLASTSLSKPSMDLPLQTLLLLISKQSGHHTLAELAARCSTQRFAWTMTSDSAAKETRDMVQALDKRGRLRDHMSTLLELADSLVTRL